MPAKQTRFCVHITSIHQTIKIHTMLLSACWIAAFCDKSNSAFDFKLFILFKFDSIFLLSCHHQHHVTVLHSHNHCWLLTKYLVVILPLKSGINYNDKFTCRRQTSPLLIPSKCHLNTHLFTSLSTFNSAAT